MPNIINMASFKCKVTLNMVKCNDINAFNPHLTGKYVILMKTT